jgi:hypothetical protein
VLAETLVQHPIRVLAFVWMPNQWHFVLWPEGDRDPTDFCRWLAPTHIMRWHAHYHTSGTDHIYQGRFKSFVWGPGVAGGGAGAQAVHGGGLPVGAGRGQQLAREQESGDGAAARGIGGWGFRGARRLRWRGGPARGVGVRPGGQGRGGRQSGGGAGREISKKTLAGGRGAGLQCPAVGACRWKAHSRVDGPAVYSNRVLCRLALRRHGWGSGQPSTRRRARRHRTLNVRPSPPVVVGVPQRQVLRLFC